MPTPRSVAVAARLFWRQQHARPTQVAPEGDWLTWLILAGRGWGKTRTGAEELAWWAVANDRTRWAVVAPTWGDLRNVCLEGDSGLVSVLRRYRVIRNYNRSLGQITLTNGSLIQGFSADRPDRLRGPQHHGAWCDELAAWRYPETWDQMKLGLRLGERPRVIATTTPRPIPRIRHLLSADETAVTRGSTFENRDNLAPTALAELEALYGGSRLGRQELYGEVLDEAEGALWSHALFDRTRVPEITERIVRRVVGVDPAVTNGEDSDETGIVVAALGESGTVYVEADLSVKASPDEWAQRVRRAVEDYDADSVLAEVNQGGDLVRQVLAAGGVRVPVRSAVASKGKAARAEPVAVMYEQGKVRHVGTLPALEDQCASWVPGESPRSPDRVDALVWAVAGLGRAMQRPRLIAT